MNRDYAAAGELFGLLRRSITFGELSMRESDGSMKYRWDFKGRKFDYSIEESVPFVELTSLRHIDSFACHVIEKWNQRARQLIKGIGCTN